MRDDGPQPALPGADQRGSRDDAGPPDLGVGRGPPHPESGISTISSQWITDYLRKQGTAQGRLRRVHFKSPGNILALQDRIAAAWRERANEESAQGAVGGTSSNQTPTPV